MRNAPSSSSARILIVDDSEGQRRFCRVVLEMGGIEVLEAEDGQQALEFLKTESFDIMVLDMKMPVLDGVEVLRQLPQARLAGEAPLIIVCSSEASATAVRHPAEFEQVSFILQKPTEPAELLNAVGLLLETRTARRSRGG